MAKLSPPPAYLEQAPDKGAAEELVETYLETCNLPRDVDSPLLLDRPVPLSHWLHKFFRENPYPAIMLEKHRACGGELNDLITPPMPLLAAGSSDRTIAGRLDTLLTELSADPAEQDLMQARLAVFTKNDIDLFQVGEPKVQLDVSGPFKPSTKGDTNSRILYGVSCSTEDGFDRTAFIPDLRLAMGTHPDRYSDDPHFAPSRHAPETLSYYTRVLLEIEPPSAGELPDMVGAAIQTEPLGLSELVENLCSCPEDYFQRPDDPALQFCYLNEAIRGKILQAIENKIRRYEEKFVGLDPVEADEQSRALIGGFNEDELGSLSEISVYDPKLRGALSDPDSPTQELEHNPSAGVHVLELSAKCPHPSLEPDGVDLYSRYQHSRFIVKVFLDNSNIIRISLVGTDLRFGD